MNIALIKQYINFNIMYETVKIYQLNLIDLLSSCNHSHYDNDKLLQEIKNVTKYLRINEIYNK